MKLQIAIDRVTLSKAEEMAKIFAGKTDIIEIGTSLIKDYGLFALKLSLIHISEPTRP